MAIHTTYTCDRCHATFIDRFDLWSVGIVCRNHPGLRAFRSDEISDYRVDWCRDCMEKMHILPPVEHTKRQEEPPPPPSLEDLIGEIVRAVIEAEREDR